MQELLWEIKPLYIIETGIAFGGMTIFYSIMAPRATVYSIDIEIREHTKDALKGYSNVAVLEVSSVSKKAKHLVKQVKRLTEDYRRPVLVSLDSYHTHDHVLQELRLYSPLVSVGSYIVVFDTTIEEYGHFDPMRNERPWGKGNNPATAVREFLQKTDDFVVDREVEQRALITAAPGGWLRRVK